MNALLSSKSSEWGTPKDVIKGDHDMIGLPELDPASSVKCNALIKAKRIIDKQEDGLASDWGKAHTVFLTPPGGKIGNQSLPVFFWEKLVEHAAHDWFSMGIFVCFSLSQLQSSQHCKRSMLSYPFCGPRYRLRFLDENGTPQNRPTHANAIVLVHKESIFDRAKLVNQFKACFQHIGECVG